MGWWWGGAVLGRVCGFVSIIPDAFGFDEPPVTHLSCELSFFGVFRFPLLFCAFVPRFCASFVLLLCFFFCSVFASNDSSQTHSTSHPSPSAAISAASSLAISAGGMESHAYGTRCLLPCESKSWKRGCGPCSSGGDGQMALFQWDEWLSQCVRFMGRMGPS